jgi:hypothetical protein
VDTLERFWNKVDTSGDCWLWTAAQNGTGYGTFKLDGKMVLAHRFVMECQIGVIPEGMVTDHLCRNRLCVRFDHLELVTQGENILRGLKGNLKPRDTHCPKGHEYTPENTYTRTDGGSKRCRICNNERMREQYRLNNSTIQLFERE